MHVKFGRVVSRGFLGTIICVILVWSGGVLCLLYLIYHFSRGGLGGCLGSLFSIAVFLLLRCALLVLSPSGLLYEGSCVVRFF